MTEARINLADLQPLDRLHILGDDLNIRFTVVEAGTQPFGTAEILEPEGQRACAQLVGIADENGVTPGVLGVQSALIWAQWQELVSPDIRKGGGITEITWMRADKIVQKL